MKKILFIFVLLIILLAGCSKEERTATGNIVEETKEIIQDAPQPEVIIKEKEEPKINFLLIGDKEECELKGGGWLKTKGTATGESHYSCHEKFSDVGMNCFDKADCKGQCVSFGAIQGYIAYGKCSEYDLIDSCEVIIGGSLKTLPDCIT